MPQMLPWRLSRSAEVVKGSRVGRPILLHERGSSLVSSWSARALNSRITTSQWKSVTDETWSITAGLYLSKRATKQLIST